MTEFQNIGLVLRSERLKADKTMEESAQRCDKSFQWLSDIERGRRRITFADALTLLEFYQSDLTVVQREINTLNKYK